MVPRFPVGGKYDLSAAAEKVRQICDTYGFDVNPKQKVCDMSVSQKQTVEIVKLLYRGVDTLILDEPTAVLTPQEADRLFDVMRNMRAEGKSVIIITHKLNEVLSISDRVAVLRKGTFAGEVLTAETNAQELTDMMVGHSVSLNIDRPESRPRHRMERIRVKNLTVRDHEGVTKLDDVSFSTYNGEILGIAGISGSGQKELLESIAGLQRPESGSVEYVVNTVGELEEVEQLVGMDPVKIAELGIVLSFVPEDRLGMGLVGNMDLADNMMLRSYRNGTSPFVDRKAPRQLAERVVDELAVKTPGIDTAVSSLSGGNVQKILVGREIASAPTVLLCAYVVRGLDVGSSHLIYDLLNRQKGNGASVVFVGEDLDVLLELCDRILVLCGGKVSGIVDARTATKAQLGLMMTKMEGGEA